MDRADRNAEQASHADYRGAPNAHSDNSDHWSVVCDAAQLQDLVGVPIRRVVEKSRPTLHAIDRQWLAGSPLCLVATSAADGTCDVSPKGDPRGFTRILDERTIAIPDRPGNRRVDGFRNILDNPHVGLIYLVPGRDHTLRINGSARLLSDAPFFDDMLVHGHRPRLVLVVRIEEVFFHCSKAFLRSSLWDMASWDPNSVSSRAHIARTFEQPDQTLETLEVYYGPSYAGRLYQ